MKNKFKYILGLSLSLVPVISVVSCDTDQLKEDLKISNDLFPSITTLIATILALGILLFVVTKFFYKPVKKMMEDRRKLIQDNIDLAKKEKDEAQSSNLEAQKKLAKSLDEANTMLQVAKQEAEVQKNALLIKAREEAEKLIEIAKQNFENEKIKFEQEQKEIIINTALEAASKLVEQNLDSSKNRDFVKEMIEGK